MTPKSDEGWSPKGGLKRGEETLGSAANFAELLRGEEVVTSPWTQLALSPYFHGDLSQLT